MKSREEEIEVEEVVQEIDSSINTDEFLANQVPDEHSYKAERKNFGYFRRGSTRIHKFRSRTERQKSLFWDS